MVSTNYALNYFFFHYVIFEITTNLQGYCSNKICLKVAMRSSTMSVCTAVEPELKVLLLISDALMITSERVKRFIKHFETRDKD